MSKFCAPSQGYPLEESPMNRFRCGMESHACGCPPCPPPCPVPGPTGPTGPQGIPGPDGATGAVYLGKATICKNAASCQTASLWVLTSINS